MRHAVNGPIPDTLFVVPLQWELTSGHYQESRCHPAPGERVWILRSGTNRGRHRGAGAERQASFSDLLRCCLGYRCWPEVGSGIRANPYSPVPSLATLLRRPDQLMSILITPRCRLTEMTRCLSELNSGLGSGRPMSLSCGVVLSSDITVIVPTFTRRSESD